MTDLPLLRALDLAAKAGAGVALDHWRRAEVTGLIEKAARDYQTAADIETEAAIARSLARDFPDATILGEEGTATVGRGLTFVVDPIDGTTNFAFRIPGWAQVICALDGERPVAGVVHDPLRGETLGAIAGGGAFLDGERLRPPPVVPEAKAIVGIGMPPGGRPRNLPPEAWRDLVWQVTERAGDVRRVGSAALALGYVALGRHHAMFEDSLDRLDYLAAALAVEELGGRVTDLDGAPQRGDGPVVGMAAGQDWVGGIIASARRAHPARRS